MRRLWAPDRRALTAGLILTITFVASESLAVITVLPVVARSLGGLRLYGWALTAFMLTSMIGAVGAGRAADRRGPAAPFVAGLLLFGSGLATAGLATSMVMLVLGRALQGLGAGVVPSVAYSSIGRALPAGLRPRMIALISTAWVAPGLAGPAIAALVAHVFGWRWVFLGLLPLVAITGLVAVAGLSGIRPADQSAAPEHRLIDAIRTSAGVALILAGLTLGFALRALPESGPLIVAGAIAAIPALRRLVPSGTLSARRGLPAAVLSRGLLTFTFFGADSYVTLSITAVRHGSTLEAGLAVTGATVAWTCGAWAQARLSARWEGRRLIRTGLAIILGGVAGLIMLIRFGLPVAVGIAAWTVAGLGMGLANSPILLLVLRETPKGREGRESASVNLADLLGSATGTGVGGAAVAAHAAGDLRLGITLAFVIAAAVGILALLITRRLPAGTTVATPQIAHAAEAD